MGLLFKWKGMVPVVGRNKSRCNGITLKIFEVMNRHLILFLLSQEGLEDTRKQKACDKLQRFNLNF